MKLRLHEDEFRVVVEEKYPGQVSFGWKEIANQMFILHRENDKTVYIGQDILLELIQAYIVKENIGEVKEITFKYISKTGEYIADVELL
jgi:hypothetical protein